MSDSIEASAKRGPGDFLREVAVVVLSILIAFGLDAWWEGRGERVAEAELLLALDAELRFNLEVLDASRTIAQSSLAASQALLALTGPDAEVRDAAALDSLLAASMLISSFDPQTGTLEQILRLDGLRLIGSEELRRELSMWDEQLRDYREDETYAVQEAVRDFLPIVRAEVPGFGLRDHPAWGDAVQPAAWLRLVRNLEFANVQSEKVYRLETLVTEFDDLEALMSRMLAAIERESA